MNRRIFLSSLAAVPVVVGIGLGVPEYGWELGSSHLLKGSRAFYVWSWSRIDFESIRVGDWVRRAQEKHKHYKVSGVVSDTEIIVEPTKAHREKKK